MIPAFLIGLVVGSLGWLLLGLAITALRRRRDARLDGSKGGWVVASYFGLWAVAHPSARQAGSRRLFVLWTDSEDLANRYRDALDGVPIPEPGAAKILGGA